MNTCTVIYGQDTISMLWGSARHTMQSGQTSVEISVVSSK